MQRCTSNCSSPTASIPPVNFLVEEILENMLMDDDQTSEEVEDLPQQVGDHPHWESSPHLKSYNSASWKYLAPLMDPGLAHFWASKRTHHQNEEAVRLWVNHFKDPTSSKSSVRIPI
jgi:hypothetical protein